MTVTLTEFLHARITEDEQAARWALEGHLDRLPTVTTRSGDVLYLGGNAARVLAECEAKRRIVQGLEDAEAATRSIGSDPKAPGDWQEWGNYHAWHEAAELIALPYSDHPDYRDEWKP